MTLRARLVRCRWKNRFVAGDDRKLTRLERGKDMTRIFAFTDGVFAIAITLLVLQIEVPTSVTSGSDLWHQIGDESGNFLAFALSFVVIGFFWIGSHRLMRQIEEFDRGLMILNIAYLGFVVLVPFSSQLIGEYGQYFVSIALYAVNLSLIAVMSYLLKRHILRNHLQIPDYEWDLRLSSKSDLFNAATFVAVLPFAYFFGTWALLLWFGNRWDPYQRKRDRVYDEHEKNTAKEAASAS